MKLHVPCSPEAPQARNEADRCRRHSGFRIPAALRSKLGLDANITAYATPMRYKLSSTYHVLDSATAIPEKNPVVTDKIQEFLLASFFQTSGS